MEVFLVSAATGALKPVLEKLAAVLGKKYKLFKKVRNEVKSLRTELEAMHAFLLKMSEEENPDLQDRLWTKAVRELSYDIEDSLDDFMVRVGDKSVKPNGFIQKCKNLLRETRARSSIAKAIEDLKTQVNDVADRNERYKIHEDILKTRNATVDKRALAAFEDASKLVGIHGPKRELIELLKVEDGCVSSQKWKVVSIFGSGGMGKTTLASKVYEVLQEKFECWAFVSVSRNPDMMNVLRNILAQVSKQPYHSTEAADIPQLIRSINCYLMDKRYLVVIDDIWKKDTWETINHALFKNSVHSRVITTTRSHDVAKMCCSSDGAFLYKIRPLSTEDSERLFFKRIFDSEYECPSQLVEVSRKILKKCDGLPLAIISISGLLASKQQTEDEWYRVQKSIGHTLENDPHVESMRQILSLSYSDLPLNLKTCLLYLSMFPEDSSINKKRLVRRWIAEGFIHAKERYTLYELGERYFHGLINRGLIQPWDIDMYGDVTACQVHDIILDFITQKSVEENFVTVSGDGYLLLSPGDKVRRLSIHSASPENISTLAGQDLSHVRSLAMFNHYVELPSLWDFSCLRVVDLEGCRRLEGHHLENIGDLFLLRYLSVRDTELTELPKSIVRLRRLLHLVVDKDVKLPDGTGSMVALQVLECVNLFKQSIEFTQEISKLTDLTDVSFSLSKADSMNCGTGGSHYKQYIDTMYSSLCKLVYLHSLSIFVDSGCPDDISLDSVGCALPRLQKFVTSGKGFISRIPNWIGSLVNLQFLTLHVREFEAEDILVLGCLPKLVILRLVAEQSFPGRRVTISGSHGFQCLRHFDFGCAIPVMFGVGAMPNLKKLTLLFNSMSTQQQAGDGYFPFGIQHLCSLNSVTCLSHEGPWPVINAWESEMNAQIAEMSCIAVKAAVVEMHHTLKVPRIKKTTEALSLERAFSKEVHANPRLRNREFLRADEWSMKKPIRGFIARRYMSVRLFVKKQIEKQTVERMLRHTEEKWLMRCRHHPDGSMVRILPLPNNICSWCQTKPI